MAGMFDRVSRRGNVEPFWAMEILKLSNELKSQGREVFPLCLGQPSTPAPTPVLEAAKCALTNEQLGYTDALGLATLRQRIADNYRNDYAATVSPEQIAITTGSSAAFTAIFLAAFEAGDAVAMTRPGYPAYRNTLSSLGCQVVELDCGPDSGWRPSIENLEKLTNYRPIAGLIIASPSNPTGTVLTEPELADIYAWCSENDVLLISDEIYHQIGFGTDFASVTQFGDEHIAVGSFSKYFSMTGWRLGWAVLPKSLVRPVELLLGNLNLSAPTLSQFAAMAAFDPQSRLELNSHVQRYRRNRDIVAAGIAEIGCPTPPPADGAFYCFPDVSHLCEDSRFWCADLLRETGVALTPGVDFATNSLPGDGLDPALDGKNFVRISYSGSTEIVTEGIRRLVNFVTNG